MRMAKVMLFACCVAACAVDGSTASDDVNDGDSVDDAPAEPLDSARIAAIAKAKKAASVGANLVISPHAASCGTNGPTSTSEHVNDAAFMGTARQRSGSSAGCTAPGALQPTDDALYYCFTCVPFIECNETWTYNQNLRTKVRGWTRDDLLRPPPGTPFGGARNECPF
jgi:hypothetical protein